MFNVMSKVARNIVERSQLNEVETSLREKMAVSFYLLNIFTY